MRDLPFGPSQDEYNAWLNEGLARVSEDAGFYAADLNDGIMMVVTAHEIGKKYPNLIPRLKEVTPECINKAMGELGLFMGAANLAKAVGLPAKEVQDMMMATFK